jgi:hypothetical protein
MRVTPTFCRHNRFVERCPICRESVPELASAATKPKRRTSTSAPVGGKLGRPTTSSAGAARGAGGGTSTRRRTEVRVHREQRFEDDGYRCELVPGVRSSHDARRLIEEIGFASGRLLTLSTDPPSLYAQARDCDDVEQATWICFLAAYLSPLQGTEPFAGIRQALLCSWDSGETPDLEEVALGPRTSHDPMRGSGTLVAYRRFAEHAGSQQAAFTGEVAWTPQRRFERLFERLALPGFGRMGRYDLLISLGRLGLYEMCADSLHLVTRSPALAQDSTPQAAKRVFAIGDPINIERRARSLAEALSTPIEALDLALYNWSRSAADERVTLGSSQDIADAGAIERAEAVLGV